MPTIIERPDPAKIQPLVQQPLAAGAQPSSMPSVMTARTPTIIEAPDPAKIQMVAPAPTAAPQQQFEPEFVSEVNRVAAGMGITPDDLMAVMDFETGGSFDPAQKNKAGSGATGLIQFMPDTARGLGTTPEALSQMTRAQQMAYVEKYLAPYKGRVRNREDLYLSILNPQNIGSTPESVMKSGRTEWRAGTPYYEQNKGLDQEGKGYITVADATRRVSNWDRALSEAGKSIARESLRAAESVGGTLPDMVAPVAVDAVNAANRGAMSSTVRGLQAQGALPPASNPEQLAPTVKLDSTQTATEAARKFYQSDRPSLAQDPNLASETYTGLAKQVITGEKPDAAPIDRGQAAADFGTKLLSDVAGITPSMATTVMGFLAGGPLGAGAVGGFLEGASQYNDAIAKGKSHAKAVEEFGVTATGTGLLNSIPFLRAFDRFLPEGYKGTAARMLLSSFFEGATETAEGGIKPIAELDKVPSSPEEAWNLLVEIGKGVYEESGVFLPAAITGVGGGLAKEAKQPPTAKKVAAEALADDLPEALIDGAQAQPPAGQPVAVPEQPQNEDDITDLLNVGDELLPEERRTLVENGYTPDEIEQMQPDQLQQALASVFGEQPAETPPADIYTMEDAQAEVDRLFTPEDKAEAVPIIVEEIRQELSKADTPQEQVIAEQAAAILDEIAPDGIPVSPSNVNPTTSTDVSIQPEQAQNTPKSTPKEAASQPTDARTQTLQTAAQNLAAIEGKAEPVVSEGQAKAFDRLVQPKAEKKPMELQSPTEVKEAASAARLEELTQQYEAAKTANNGREGQRIEAQIASVKAGVSPEAEVATADHQFVVGQAIKDRKPVNAEAMKDWANVATSNGFDENGNIPRRGIPAGYQQVGDVYVFQEEGKEAPQPPAPSIESDLKTYIQQRVASDPMVEATRQNQPHNIEAAISHISRVAEGEWYSGRIKAGMPVTPSTTPEAAPQPEVPAPTPSTGYTGRVIVNTVSTESAAAETQAPSSSSKANTPAFDGLPRKSQDLFNTAFESGDAAKLKEMVEPRNNTWRSEFESRTGIKLPRAKAGTNKAVDAYLAQRTREQSSPDVVTDAPRITDDRAVKVPKTNADVSRWPYEDAPDDGYYVVDHTGTVWAHTSTLEKARESRNAGTSTDGQYDLKIIPPKSEWTDADKEIGFRLTKGRPPADEDIQVSWTKKNVTPTAEGVTVSDPAPQAPEPTRREKIAQRRAIQKAQLADVPQTPPQPAGPRGQYAIPGQEDLVADTEQDIVDKDEFRGFLENIDEPPTVVDDIMLSLWPAMGSVRDYLKAGLGVKDAVDSARREADNEYLEQYPDLEDAILTALDNYGESLLDDPRSQPEQVTENKEEPSNEPETGERPVGQPPVVESSSAPGGDGAPPAGTPIDRAGETTQPAEPKDGGSTGKSVRTSAKGNGVRGSSGSRNAGNSDTGMGSSRKPTGETSKPSSTKKAEEVQERGDGVADESEKESTSDGFKENHRISDDDVIAPRGNTGKIKANITAIQLLKELEEQNREATREEKKVLARYTGWGHSPQVLDDAQGELWEKGYWGRNKSESWRDKYFEYYKTLKSLLSEKEWLQALKSTGFAHFTSREVVNGMWDIARHLGFSGGRVLEPAAGIGNFLGLIPEDFSGSTLIAVEIDEVSVRLLKKLYPKAKIYAKGFESAKIPNNSIDLVITNVPFAAQKMSFPGYPALSLHNFFFARSLDVLRPGGVVISVTSHFSMDANATSREFLSTKGNLVGAIRLPGGSGGAFKANADTDVTTDIIILQKKRSPNEQGEDWALLRNVGTEEQPIMVNEYFANHPEMVLGIHSMDGTMRGPDPAYQLNPFPGGRDITEQIREAMKNLPENIFGEKVADNIDFGKIDEAEDQKPGSYHLKDGKVVVVSDGKFVDAGFSDELAKRAKDFIELRNHYRQHLTLMRDSETSDKQYNESLKKLNEIYDRYVKNHDGINSKKGKLFDGDPGYYLLAGTEKVSVAIDPKTKKKKETYSKGDVYSKRTVNPAVIPVKADSSEDALKMSLAYKGRIDEAWIAQLTGMEEQKALNELLEKGVIFIDPETGNAELAELYLSGNVKNKLAIAKGAGAKYEANVEALEKVQPERRKFSSIKVSLGSTWIPDSLVQDFSRALLGKQYFKDRIQVSYLKEVDKWIVEVVTGKGVSKKTDAISVAGLTEYAVIQKDKDDPNDKGYIRRNGIEVLEAVLNQKEMLIYKPKEHKDDPNVLDEDLTREAKIKMDMLREAFTEWVKADQERMSVIEDAFNENYNFYVNPVYDGSHLQLPGKSSTVNLYDHQKNAIWRMIVRGHGMLAHAVGAGKTYSIIGAVMEMKRLGIHKKPMVVVQNSTMEQYARSFTAMYPEARILIADAKTLEAKNRKKFLSMIAANDYDAVIIAQSQFDRLPSDPVTEETVILGLINELAQARSELVKEGEDEKSQTVKELAEAIRKLEDKLAANRAKRKKREDDVVYFEELGVDALFIDEAHSYKKPPFVTKLPNLMGLNKTTSQIATNLLMKSHYIRKKRAGKGVFLATGTPVTNTLGESWHMLNLTSPEILKEFGVDTFDRFVSIFAEVGQEWTQNAGGQWKPRAALGRFANAIELIKMVRAEWDVLMKDELDQQLRDQGKEMPEIEGGSPTVITVEATPRTEEFSKWVKRVYARFKALDGRARKEYGYIPALLYGASRAIATDSRLIYPDAPDEPGSKVNRMVSEVIKIHQETAADRLTQMIFVDMFNPFKMDTLNRFAAGLDGPGDDISFGNNEESEEENEAAKEEARNAEIGGFVVNDIINKLVKAGVKREEIALMATAKTDAQKQAIFDGMNSGSLRILIGSTQRMGVGVNAQDRMIALHHLDTPWFPALLEQREGRILRQGNINKTVKIFSYGMKQTLDSAIYSKLLYKVRFIRQILSGKVDSDDFDDPAGGITLSIEEAMAASADNPYLFRKLEAMSELRDIEVRRRTFLDSAAQRVSRLAAAKAKLRDAKAAIDRITKALPETIVSKSPTLKVDGKEYTLKEFKEVFESTLEENDSARDLDYKYVSWHTVQDFIVEGKRNEALKLFGKVNGTGLEFAVLASKDTKLVSTFVFHRDLRSAITRGRKIDSFKNLLDSFHEVSQTDLEIKKSEEKSALADIEFLEKQGSNTSFPQEDEYQALKAEIADLNQKLLEWDDDTPGPSSGGFKDGLKLPPSATISDPIEAISSLLRNAKEVTDRTYDRARPALERLFEKSRGIRDFLMQLSRKIGALAREYGKRFVEEYKQLGNRGAARIPLTSEEEQQMVRDATKVIIYQMRRGVLDSAQLTRTAYAAAVKKLGKPFSITQFRPIATKAKRIAEPVRAQVAKNQKANDKQTPRIVAGTSPTDMPRIQKGGPKSAAEQVQAILDHVRESEPRGIRAGYRAGRLSMQAQNRELLLFAKNNLPRGEYKLVAAAMESIIKAPPSRGLEVSRKALVRAVNKMVEKFEKASAVKELKQALSKADKTKLRPEFRKAIDGLMDDLALTNPKDSTLARAQSVIDAAKRDDIGEIPKRLIERMNEILKDAKKRKVADYSTEEIQDITNGILNLLHLNQTKNQLIFGRRRMNRQEAMRKAMEELRERRPKELQESSRTESDSALVRLATTGQSNLETLVLDHAKEGGVVHGILVDGLTTAQTEFLRWQQRAMDAIQPLVKRIGYDELSAMSDVLSGYDRVGRGRKAIARIVGERILAIKQPKLHEIALPDGKAIKMTGAERAAFYAAWNDPETRAEMLKDRGQGIVFARDPLKARTKIDADSARAILASVTPNEKAIADKMREHINGPLRKALSKWWVDNHGYDPFKNDEYFPMRRLFDNISEPEEAAVLTGGALDKQGIFQDRVRNTRPIIIGDIFGVYLAHANRTAALLGKAAPVNEAMRLLEKDSDFTKAMIRRNPRGKSVVDEMRKRVEDFGLIQFHSQDAFSAFIHTLIRNSTVANLAFNAPVIVSQPISLLSAQADMPSRYLTVGLKEALKHPKKSAREIFEWAPQLRAVIEGSGHQVVTPETAGASAQEFFGHRGIGTKLMTGISKSNEITVWAIWEAAKAEAAAQGLRGDEMMERAAERATVVYNRSQPNFNMVSTAGIKLDARKSPLTAVATMYSGQTAVMWQQVRRAVTQYRHGDINAAKLVKDVLVPTLVQGIAFNTIKHGWKLGLVAAGLAAQSNDDDDDAWINIMMEAIKDAFGIVLIGGQAFDFLLNTIEKRVRGLAITDNTLRYEANPIGSLFMETGSAINDIVAAAGKVGTHTEARVMRGLTKLLNVLGQFFGIPVRPVTEIIKGAAG